MNSSTAQNVAAAAADVPIDWHKEWPGIVLEGSLALAGVIVLALFLAKAWRRGRWFERRAPAWPGSGLDVAFFLLGIIAALFIFLGLFYLAARFGFIHEPTAVVLLNVFATEGALLAAIGVYHFRYRRLRLNREQPAAIRLGIAVFLLVVPLVILLVLWAWTALLTWLHYPLSHQTLVDFFTGLSSWWSRGLFTLFAVVVAPCTEEIIFRGVIYRGLAKYVDRRWAIVASAAIFGLAHVDLSSFLPLFALGVIFALAYDETGSIWVTIIAHGLFNLNTLAALSLGWGS